jgi:hypothetical protein
MSNIMMLVILMAIGCAVVAVVLFALIAMSVARHD